MNDKTLLVFPDGTSCPFFSQFEFILRDLDFKNYVTINIVFWHTNNFNEDTKKQVIDNLLNLRMMHPEIKTFVFQNTHETIQFQTYSVVSDVVKTLVEKHNFKISDFMLVSAGSPVKYNIESFKRAAKENNWTQIKIMFSNVYEKMFFIHNDLDNEFYKNLNSEIKDKEKVFLFLNGSSRYHRNVLVSEFFQSGLDKKSYMSAHNFNSMDSQYMSSIPGPFQNHFNFLLNNPGLLPIKLADVEVINDISWRIWSNEIEHYENSYVDLITETKFIRADVSKTIPWISHDTCMLDSYFVTEKTMKAFAGKMPFIIASIPLFLDALRELGYKTFHPYIDETYDTIEDHDLRLAAIIKEIYRLASFSKEQWREWSEKVHPIAMHNYNHFKNYKPKILIYDPDPI